MGAERVHVVDYKALGKWVRLLRKTSELSQEALAASANVNSRTVQRLEAGTPVNSTNLRLIARALGYDDPDVFFKPEFQQFLAWFHQSIASLTEEHAKREIEKAHPESVLVEVTPTDSGKTVGQLAEVAEVYLGDYHEATSAEVQQTAAELFDLFRDYGDVHDVMGHQDRLETYEQFASLIASLKAGGAVLLVARRNLVTRMPQENGEPKEWRTVQVILDVAPADQVPDRLAVPRRMKW